VGCDWPGSIVEVDVGMFSFRGFGVSVVSRGATSFPHSTTPDKHSEKDQQDTDSDTSGDPSDRRCAQPVKWVLSRGLNTTRRVVLSYVEGGGQGVGLLLVLQINRITSVPPRS